MITIKVTKNQAKFKTLPVVVFVAEVSVNRKQTRVITTSKVDLIKNVKRILEGL